MRITPLIGKKLWFAPRRDFLGWGWSPVSWEGWATSAVAIVLIVVPAVRVETQRSGGWWPLAWVLLVTFILLATCVLKGTSPGGRKKFDEFRRLKSK